MRAEWERSENKRVLERTAFYDALYRRKFVRIRRTTIMYNIMGPGMNNAERAFFYDN